MDIRIQRFCAIWSHKRQLLRASHVIGVFMYSIHLVFEDCYISKQLKLKPISCNAVDLLSNICQFDVEGDDAW